MPLAVLTVQISSNEQTAFLTDKKTLPAGGQRRGQWALSADLVASVCGQGAARKQPEGDAHCLYNAARGSRRTSIATRQSVSNADACPAAVLVPGILMPTW